MSRARRVLVVEDEYLIAMDLKRVLEQAGLEVIGPVPSVSQALGLLEGQDVDGAVLDINLGSENVFPVCEALVSRQVQFVFATGYNAEDVPEAWRQVTRFEKPVSSDQLARAFKA